MAKANRRGKSAVTQATTRATAPAAAPPQSPTTKPTWTNMLEPEHAQQFAGIKLRYLEKLDRVGLVGLLRKKQLGEWLARQAHQAAVLHERLTRGKIPVADIEKEVAAVLTPSIEQQQDLPATIEQELEQLLADWKKGEGRLFTSL